MNKNDLAEIKNMDQKGLIEKINLLNEEILELKLDKKIGKLNNPKQIRNKRKNLAQISTVLRQKQLLEELTANSKQSTEKKSGLKEQKGGKKD